MSTENSVHHPLLHREIQTGTENVANVVRKSALLPVVTVKNLGCDQNLTANCLLDSGAQISLVMQSVVEETNLKGKPVTINITKRGKGC